MSNALLLLALCTVSCWSPTEAFSSPVALTRSAFCRKATIRYMSSEEPATTTEDSASDPMEDAMDDLDDATRTMMEKSKRADELRSQEVFMKKSTGKHKCTNCDWEFDETKGDSIMIGGMIKPGTTFKELPSNWRCPVCRASKDSFDEVLVEIPGFEVNQGYGLGTNSWSAGQKNGVIFGGLAIFFILFIGGYGMS